MALKKDYYEVLGVGRNADQAAIKKAYRKLAKKYHPDSNAGNAQAEQRFKEVSEAYSILSDPEKKKLYDQFGEAAFEGGPAPGASSGGSSGFYGAGPGGYREYHFDGGDDDMFGDLFGHMFHGKGASGSGGGENGGARFHTGSFHTGGFHGDDFFRDFGQGAYDEYEGYGKRGANLTAEVSVSFEEAALGCEKVITIQNPKESGGRTKSLKVRIPAGIESGKSIRLAGLGMDGAGGQEAGDLLLKVMVQDSSAYERRGLDVYTTVSVPFTTAVFGGEALVHTLYGDVICKIKEGTQSGTKIRLRGKGIVSMKNHGVHGDQYVAIQIQVPRNLSQEEKKKLKEYEAVCGKNGRGHVA